MNKVHEVVYFSSVHIHILFDCAIYVDVYTVIKKTTTSFYFYKGVIYKMSSCSFIVLQNHILNVLVSSFAGKRDGNLKSTKRMSWNSNSSFMCCIGTNTQRSKEEHQQFQLFPRIIFLKRLQLFYFPLINCSAQWEQTCSSSVHSKQQAAICK